MPVGFRQRLLAATFLLNYMKNIRMKNLFKITPLVILISLASCKDDNGPSKQDIKIEMLTGSSWGHAQVTHTDGDLSDQYTDFAIVFTGNASDGFDGTFVVSNGGNAFAENSGKWKFNDDMTKITFDSEKELEFEVDEDHLTLDFIVPASGGRMAGLSGHFVFELQPM